MGEESKAHLEDINPGDSLFSGGVTAPLGNR